MTIPAPICSEASSRLTAVDARTIESAFAVAMSCDVTAARFFGARGSFGAATGAALSIIGVPA